MSNSHIYHILIYLNIISFILGYVICKIFHKTETINLTGYKNSNNKKSIDNRVASVNIDDTKYVVSIDTDGIEKKFQEITTTKESEESISGAINKLKNMKG